MRPDHRRTPFRLLPAASTRCPLWSPYTGDNTGAQQDFITGGALLNIDGTLFMGYAAFNYAGQATNLQTRAQLVTRILNLTGGSVLRMTPDASRSTISLRARVN